MQRELYVYWKTARPEAAVEIGRIAQDALRAAETGLQARLLWREPREARPATLMEIYHRERGIDAALQARIERTLAAATRDLLAGARHVEVFADA